ncbi:outer membrane protein assembly factor BamA [Pelagibacterium mangrovi]|uniref:outer membrane protein assembly factor BamA n=1 Tax=Pelagibacterium mangrovi TaxID=3119828 RepID=UPI002FC5F674
MTKSAKLLHSVLLAMALFSFAPFMGSAALVLGVPQAQAQVAEGTQVAAIGFDGNSRFNDNQLQAMVDVAMRRVYTQAGIATDIQTIQAAYSQAGYSNVTVTHRVEPTTDGRVRVLFDVNEGDRAGIAAINFTGNNSMSSSVLKGVITTKETHLLSWLFRDDVYAEDRLALDRERVRLYYANRGFPDARVLSAVAQFDAERNAYYINFTVDEGQRYNFGNIAIETSIPGLNADALRGDISTGSGSRYSLSDLSATTGDLAIGATNQGYPFAEVRPRINRNLENGTFDVTYLVDEGPRIYVERINITGNTKTRDYVIRREFDFSEGDPFNRALVTKGRANIEALGFFQSVQVTSAPGSSADRVILNVAVVERSTGDYGVGAGYSTRDGIFGEISLTERNFLGRGQYLRAAIGRSENGETYDFSFTEPRFMGLRVSAGVDLYRRVTGESSNFTYSTETTGGRLRFGIPVAEDLTLSTRVGLEQVTFSNTGDAPDYLGGTRDRLSVGYTLTYDTLDNQRRPTEGMILSFSQDYTTLTSDFLTTEVRARVYYPIWEEMGMVASLRGTAGTVTDVDGNGIHPTDAMQLGPDLVRGYRYGGMGARVASGENGAGNPVGILSYAGLSAEVDFPIPLLPENWGIRGAVWGDVGWIDGIPDTQGVETTGLGTEFKSSVGGSLIWESPLGPLRGDFAHVIDPDDQDETQVFQLTLSTLF